MATRLGYYRKLAKIGLTTGTLPAEFKPEYVLELISIAEDLRNAAMSISIINESMLEQAIHKFNKLDKWTTQYD